LRETLLAAGATLFNAASYYILTVFALAHFTTVLGFSRSTVLTAMIIAAVVSTVMIPAAGAISDRIGRRSTYIGGATGLAVWFFPMFWLVGTGDLVWVTIGFVVAHMLFSFTYGPAPALFAEMFGDGVRYTGISLGYQLGAVLGGAFAPIIATALYTEFGTTDAVATYVAAVAGISIVSVALTSHARRGMPVVRGIPS
jgi:MFS family permease